jgi:hypothetical protein
MAWCEYLNLATNIFGLGAEQYLGSHKKYKCGYIPGLGIADKLSF